MRKCLIIICMTAVIIAGFWLKSPAKAEHDRIPIEIYECTLKDVTTSVFFTGFIDSGSETSLCMAKNTEVSRVCVEIGDEVNKGDVLFIGNVSNSQPNKFFGNDITAVMSSIAGNVNSSSIIYEPDSSGKYLVRSPIDGVVKTMTISPGDVVGSGVPCITVTSLKNLEVRADVPEEYIQNLDKGMPCEITGEAFHGTVYHGHIEQIMPYAKTSSILTGSRDTVVEVTISLDDADNELRSGYSARVEASTGYVTDVITVPYRAIDQDDDGSEFVYVYDNGVALKRSVTTGMELMNTTEITSGLRAGDKIILDPFDLHDGSLVKAVNLENR